MVKKIKIVFGVFLLASVISYFLINANEKQFNAAQWQSSPLTRYKMSKDIIESNLLIGNTKTETINLLGKPTTTTLKGKDHFVYSLGKTPSFFETEEQKLVLIFENDKVVKVIHSEE